MLSIGKLSPGQDRYYLEQAEGRVDVVQSVADGVEDYYGEHDEARGVWLGRGAARLGLAGGVDGESLRAMLAGLRPSDGAILRAAPVKVAGFDLTFSAPKSVSVLFGVADTEVTAAIRAGHDAAVAETFAYLDANAAAVRRGAGGVEVLRADGLIAAGFRHRTSRAGDPQLHTHVLVANLAHGPDGRWSAIDGRRIYSHARAASFIYQAVLRSELTRSLGVEWTPVRDGIAEIAGVPDEVLRAFSRRRAEIQAELVAHGTSGPRASEAAALSTRRAKDRDVDPDTLVTEWRERAERHGLSAGDVERLLDRAPGRSMTPEAWERLADELAGPLSLTREASSFTRRDVIVALCEHVPPGAHLDCRTLERVADRFLTSERVVALLPADRSRAESFVRRDGQRIPLARDERRYSTPELLARERRLVEFATRGRATRAGVASPIAVEHALSTRPSLSDEQVAVIRKLCETGDRVDVVAGRAGTGKTYALGAAHDAWRDSGVHVIGVAVARRAARELQDGAGIPATSIAQLLGELARGRSLPPRSVLVVDEASMAGTRQLAALTDAVEQAAGKLVLVGDHRQLPALEAGGAFRSLVQRGLAIELTENRRQAELWERTAVEHLRNGRVDEAIDLYQRHDRIRIEPTDQALRELLVRDWWNGGDNAGAIMIAQRRSDVADLNWRARSVMRAAGRLGDQELRTARDRIAVGDRILIRANHPATGLCNGDQATVIAIDTGRRTATLAVGDRRVVAGPDLLHAQTARGDPAVMLGYAITGHAAQGITVDRAHVLADPTITREWAYTAMTRGRRANHVYLASTEERVRDEYAPADREPPHPMARLKARLAPERSEALALDLVPGAEGWDEALRRHDRLARVRSVDIAPDRDLGLGR